MWRCVAFGLPGVFYVLAPGCAELTISWQWCGTLPAMKIMKHGVAM